MKAKQSSFILKDFLLLKQNFEFIPCTDNLNAEIPGFFSKYNIDIDFQIKKDKEKNILIYIKSEINNIDHKEFGYSIYAEGVGIFTFSKTKKILKTDEAKYVYNSGVPICINCLRTVIANITSFGPWGKYILPTIDMNELLNDKKNSKQPK